MIKVLKGGLDPSNLNRYKFISGVVSDTRLMGVVAMHLIFSDTALPDNPNEHQFYYFDYEELGLESLKIVYSNDFNEIKRDVKQCFAGLGAQIIEITESEAYYLANWMIEDTKNKKQELPEEIKEIPFVQARACELSKDEIDALNSKMCVKIKTDYGVVNYYLMRYFGRDLEALKFVSESNANIEDLGISSHCTFLRNKITTLPETAGTNKVYRCETLIELESEQIHHLIVSEIEVYKRKVVGVKKISDISLSLYETSMLLAREEFVTVFEFKDNIDIYKFSACFEEFTLGMTQNSHSNGDMFMEFKPDNNHAESKLFMLSNDVQALYYVAGINQIVVAAYNMEDVLKAEMNLALSTAGEFLDITNRYKFAASIIYDFAESGFTDFNEYINSIN